MAKGRAKKARTKASKGSQNKLKKNHESTNSKSDDVSNVDRVVLVSERVVGLENLGNTCFFNSVLQSLAALEEVREQYGAPKKSTEDSDGPLHASLRVLLQGMGSAAKVYNPRPVFDAICKRAPQFKSMQQQDSHELLRFLLDGLQTEEMEVVKRRQGGQEECELPSAWVDLMFGGELVWSTTCKECLTNSSVMEPFLDISLSIPANPATTQVSAVAAVVTLPDEDSTHEKKSKSPNPNCSKEKKRALKEERRAKKRDKTASKRPSLKEDPEEKAAKETRDSLRQEPSLGNDTEIPAASAGFPVKAEDEDAGVIADNDDADTIENDTISPTFIREEDSDLPPPPSDRREVLTRRQSSLITSDDDLRSRRVSSHASNLDVYDCSGNLDQSHVPEACLYEHVEKASGTPNPSLVGKGRGNSPVERMSPEGGSEGDGDDEWHGDRFGRMRHAREIADTIEAFAGTFAQLSASERSPPPATLYLGGEAQGDEDTDQDTDYHHFSQDDLEQRGGSSIDCSDEDGDLMNVSPTGMVGRSMEDTVRSIGDLVNTSVLSGLERPENEDWREEGGPLDGPLSGRETEDAEWEHTLGGQAREDGIRDRAKNSGESNGAWSREDPQRDGNGVGLIGRVNGGVEMKANSQITLLGCGGKDKVVEVTRRASSISTSAPSEQRSDSELSVLSCWRSFIIPEELSGESAYACEECSRRASCTLKVKPRPTTSRKAKHTPKRKAKFKPSLGSQSMCHGVNPAPGFNPAEVANEEKSNTDPPEDVQPGPCKCTPDGRTMGESSTVQHAVENKTVRIETCCSEFEQAQCSNCLPSKLRQFSANYQSVGRVFLDSTDQVMDMSCNGGTKSAQAHSLVDATYGPSCSEPQKEPKHNSDKFRMNCIADGSQEPSRLVPNDIEVKLTVTLQEIFVKLIVFKESGTETDVAIAQKGKTEVSRLEARGNEKEQREEETKEKEKKEGGKSIMVLRDAVREVMVRKAPKILTVHLKRFQQDMRGKLTKINTHVDFEEELHLEVHDLKIKGEDSDKDSDMDRIDSRAKGTARLSALRKRTVRYVLVGIVVHMGTMRGGHYIAYVRRGSEESDSVQWYYTSDRSVNLVSFETVKACDAYLLFYSLIE